MKRTDAPGARRTLLLLAMGVGIALGASACRSGAQVPKSVALPVIRATVSPDVCLNAYYPDDAPQLGDNAAIPYVTHPSGLKTYDRAVGSGDRPSPTSVVTVHYTGWLEDGCVFDSSYVRGVPGDFDLDRLIPGWAEGVEAMRPGGRRRMEIPPHLAYGTIGFPGVIPPNSVIVFEVELLSFAEPTPTPEPGAEPTATPTP